MKRRSALAYFMLGCAAPGLGALAPAAPPSSDAPATSVMPAATVATAMPVRPAAAIARAETTLPGAPARQGERYTLADVAFLAGAWQADFHGQTLEEHFSAPAGGTIMAMFRWIREDRTTVTEHIVLEEDEDGVSLRMRHFSPGLVGWTQEADGPLRFRLVAAAKGRATFEDPERSFPRRLVYERSGPGALTARLEGRGDDGEEQSMEFNYRSLTMTTTTAATDALTDAGKALGYDGGLTLAITVSDLDKSIAFYRDVVGFKVQFKLAEMGWCELTTSVPHVNIGLSQVENPAPGQQTPTFGVTDIDHTRKLLEDRGVKFDGETYLIPDMVKLATFFDPDGNPIKLYQSLSDEMP